MGNITTARGMLILFLACCPTAIARFVVAIVVDSVNGVFGRRLFAHVRPEDSELVPPCVTDGNAPAAVVLISRIVRIVAAIFHGLPGSIFCGIPSSMFSDGVHMETAATLRRTDPHGFGLFNHCLAAGAVALPVISEMSFNDRKASINVSCEIDAYHLHSVAYYLCVVNKMEIV